MVAEQVGVQWESRTYLGENCGNRVIGPSLGRRRIHWFIYLALSSTFLRGGDRNGMARQNLGRGRIHWLELSNDFLRGMM